MLSSHHGTNIERAKNSRHAPANLQLATRRCACALTRLATSQMLGEAWQSREQADTGASGESRGVAHDNHASDPAAGAHLFLALFSLR